MAGLTLEDLDDLMTFVIKECHKPPATSIYDPYEEVLHTPRVSVRDEILFPQTPMPASPAMFLELLESDKGVETSAPEEVMPADPRKEPVPGKCWTLPVPVFENEPKSSLELKNSDLEDVVPIDPRKKTDSAKIITLPVPVFETEKTGLATLKENPVSDEALPPPAELKKEAASKRKRKFYEVLDTAQKKMRLKLKDFKIPRVKKDPGDSTKKCSSKDSKNRDTEFFKENSKKITVDSLKDTTHYQFDENSIVILNPDPEDYRYVFGSAVSKKKSKAVTKEILHNFSPRVFLPPFS